MEQSKTHTYMVDYSGQCTLNMDIAYNVPEDRLRKYPYISYLGSQRLIAEMFSLAPC